MGCTTPNFAFTGFWQSANRVLGLSLSIKRDNMPVRAHSTVENVIVKTWEGWGRRRGDADGGKII